MNTQMLHPEITTCDSCNETILRCKCFSSFERWKTAITFLWNLCGRRFNLPEIIKARQSIETLDLDREDEFNLNDLIVEVLQEMGTEFHQQNNGLVTNAAGSENVQNVLEQLNDQLGVPLGSFLGMTGTHQPN